MMGVVIFQTAPEVILSTVTAPSRTREDLIADIRDMYAKLDRQVPTGLSKMRKADLVNLQAHLLDMYATHRTAASAQIGDDTPDVMDAYEEAIEGDDEQPSLRPLFSHAGRRPTVRQRAHRRIRNRMQRASRRRNRR